MKQSRSHSTWDSIMIDEQTKDLSAYRLEKAAIPLTIDNFEIFMHRYVSDKTPHDDLSQINYD